MLVARCSLQTFSSIPLLVLSRERDAFVGLRLRGDRKFCGSTSPDHGVSQDPNALGFFGFAYLNNAEKMVEQVGYIPLTEEHFLPNP